MANEFKVKKGLIVNGSGSTILDIQGSQGQLFSVTDQLSGSLFSVNDISGIPVFEAFSDNTVKIGLYLSESIVVSGNNSRITGSLFGTASWAQNSITASYALILTDQDKLVEMNVGSANTLTVPSSTDVNFPIGTQILLTQYGAGQTSILASATFPPPVLRSLGGALKLNGQYSAASLIKIATDEWDVFGNLTI
jgi:hypothetical protein